MSLRREQAISLMFVACAMSSDKYLWMQKHQPDRRSGWSLRAGGKLYDAARYTDLTSPCTSQIQPVSRFNNSTVFSNDFRNAECKENSLFRWLAISYK